MSIFGRSGGGDMNSIYRRDIIAAVAVVLILILAVSPVSDRSKSYEQTAFAMGTVFQISLRSSGDDPTPGLIELANELDRDILSYRSDTSEIARINSTAGKAEGCELSEDMEEIITQCLAISQQTDGAFDITIGALTKLWNIDGWASGDLEADGLEFVPPTESEIKDALSKCGYEKVRIENHRIYLPKGMSLDLGAVGKGIYLDRCAEYVQGTSGIISAGGSVRTCGKKGGTNDWNVGITDPFDKSQMYGKISVPMDLCISTSGPYERCVYYNNERYHHILDPKTGYPVNTDLESVTIVSPGGLICDALSTACFVTGEEKAKELALSYGADILMIRSDGSQTGTITADK